jgi:hypothetical protein
MITCRADWSGGEEGVLLAVALVAGLPDQAGSLGKLGICAGALAGNGFAPSG